MRFGRVLLFVAACHFSVAMPGPSSTAAAQAITGTTSLIRIPTAGMPSDGLVRATTGFVHSDYTPRGGRHVVQYGVSMAFLPFLELGFRFNNRVGARDALGDRMIAVRLRAWDQLGWRPAVVFGAHDFIRSSTALTTRYHALYAVASMRRRLRLGALLVNASIHGGYAVDLLDARGYELRGLFAGIEASPGDFVTLLVEHDSRTANAGVRVRILRYFDVLAGVQGFDRFTGGATFAVQL